MMLAASPSMMPSDLPSLMPSDLPSISYNETDDERRLMEYDMEFDCTCDDSGISCSVPADEAACACERAINKHTQVHVGAWGLALCHP